MINRMKSAITGGVRELRATAAPALESLGEISAFLNRNSIVSIWILGIVYRILLDYLYVQCASPLYNYAGLVYAPNFFKYIASWVMYIVLLAVLPKKEGGVAALMHLQFAYSVAPMLSFYALGNQSTKYIVMVVICILVQSLLINRKQEGGKRVSITGIQNYVSVALGLLVIMVLVIPVLYNGFNGLAAFDFSFIYTMRASEEYPGLGFTYFLDWVPKMILPFGVLYCLLKKKYWPIVPMVAAQLLVYLETGRKYYLLILIPVVLIYFCFRSGHLIKLMYAGLTAVYGVTILANQMARVTGDGATAYLSFLVSVRAIFHPADNKFNYFDFFSEYPKLYYSDGRIGQMFSETYLYGGSVGQVIYADTGGTWLEANLNTGYLGESYAQMGFLGMLLMSVILALLLRVLKNYERTSYMPVIVALFAIFMILLNDIPLLTVLLTGGMLLAYVLIFVYFGKDGKEQEHGIQRK